MINFFILLIGTHVALSKKSAGGPRIPAEHPSRVSAVGVNT